MADGKMKPAMSLNQLHNRYLSASQSNKPRTQPADDTVHKKVFESAPGNDDVPRFDIESSSPSTQGKTDVEESVSRTGDTSPGMFDFDSPSSTIGKRDVEDSVSKTGDTPPGTFSGFSDFDSPPSTLESISSHENSKTTEDDGSSFNMNPTSENRTDRPDDTEPDHTDRKLYVNEGDALRKEFPLSGVADFDGNTSAEVEHKETKVRIEGRRRLCKLAKSNDSDCGAERDFVRDDGLSDFDSPNPMNKAHESGGNEIRDILNDLSSRLEILSIEKKRVPKKVDKNEDFLEPLRNKLYDVTITEEQHEHETSSSNLLSSAFPEESIQSKVGGTVAPVDRHGKKYHDGAKDANFKDKVNKSVFKGIDSYERVMPHVKPGTATKSQAYNFKGEDEDCNITSYKDSSARHTIKQVNRRHEKVIELSDDETDEVSKLDSHDGDFSLSGPKGTYKLPAKIAKILFPHQREGLKWLWSLYSKGKGGILGDDMGLGKTMQMCSFIAGLFHSNLTRRVLVVAPKTLLTHWINELSKVGLSEMTKEYFSTCTRARHYELQYVLQNKGILLTTYDIVRNNTKSLCGDYNDDEEDPTWDYVILDEGHLIKNPSTQRAKSLLQLPCRHRIIISGTPLQNNLKELWALFNFCCPELLGDKKEFKERYENFINRGNEKNASDREKRIGSSVAKDLRDCIQPYFLRRLKSEVFSDDSLLSKKNEMIVWLKLTPCQRQLYEAFLKSEIVLSAFDGSPLAALTILKKICDHPLLLTKRAAEDVLEGMDSIVNQEDHRVAEKLAMHIADVAERFDIVADHDISCKISFILSLLGDLVPKGHKVLIFSQTRKMLNIIQESLVSNHYDYMRIDGTTKIGDRAKVVKDFQEGSGAPIFLLTSQVGGLGLTLTNADRVIVVDPAWNPSTDNQSVDRAYRIGQKKDVIVYRLMTCSTVEEKIYRKQVFKGGLFRSATEHKEQIRYFSQQDLRDLFSLPKHGFDISPTQQQLLEEHDSQHVMEESLKDHVKFLETLNIAGVSQHSLLFSKEAPAQVIEIEDDDERLRGSSKFVANPYARSSKEHVVDGAHYAYKPKDVKRPQRSSSPENKGPSEKQIRDKIDRLSQIFANQDAVSRLPDRGQKLQNRMVELRNLLDQMQIAKDVDSSPDL